VDVFALSLKQRLKIITYEKTNETYVENSKRVE